MAAAHSQSVGALTLSDGSAGPAPGGVRLEDESVEVLREALTNYTSIALSFKRRSLYEHALRSLRSAFAACEALRDQLRDGVLRPGIVLLKAKTRLNISAVLALDGQPEEAYRECVHAKDELSRLLLAWWEQTPEEERPYLYAVPVHVEVAASLALAFRAGGRLLAARGDEVSARAYHEHALRTALTLLPSAHALVALLRSEAGKRGWAAATMPAAATAPASPTGDGRSPRSLDSSPDRASSRRGSQPRGVRLSLSRLPTLRRPSTTAGPETADASGRMSLSRSLTEFADGRPNTSPAALVASHAQHLAAQEVDDTEKKHRTNPFDEFLSSSDLEQLTKRRMLLLDSVQESHRVDFRFRSTRLREEVRARTPDELYDNRVLFSKHSHSLWEVQHGWGPVPGEKVQKDFVQKVTAKDKQTAADVSDMKKRIKFSHRRMVDEVRDLFQLEKVVEQAYAKEKKSRSKDSDSAKGKSGRKKAAMRELGLSDLLNTLSREDKASIRLLGFDQKDLEVVAKIFLRFQAKDGHYMDPAAFGRALRTALKGEYSEARFVDMWNTMIPPRWADPTGQVGFLALCKWAAQCLPIQDR